MSWAVVIPTNRPERITRFLDAWAPLFDRHNAQVSVVVDDEATVRTVLADILTGAGHEVVEVDDGAEAIARFRAEPFDIVVTDLAMPRVSGWQVARAVKHVAPAVPVFLVTGFGVELSAEERRANGVDAWYVVYADEGHGFLKKHNNDLRREVETVFLQRIFAK